MNDQRFDVIVIGASLAGASAALSFREKKNSVLVLDKSHFPRQKVCGEFLSPALWPWFEKMGLKERILKSGFHSIEKAILYSPKGRRVEIEFEQPALGLSRYYLDQILLETAKERGAVVQERSLVTEKNQEAEGWSLKVVKSGFKKEEFYLTKKLIDASGKPAVLGKNLKTKNEMLGFQAHFENVIEMDQLLELYFFREGYGGIVKVENGLVNACFLLKKKNIPLHLLPRNSAEFMQWIFQRHPVLKDRVERAHLRGNVHTTGPLVYGLRTKKVSGQDLLHVGDSLGVIDPFFGQGMTIAFQTGWMSGQCADLREYTAWTQKYLRQRFWLAHFFRKALRFSGALEMAFSILGKNKPLSQVFFKMAHGY